MAQEHRSSPSPTSEFKEQIVGIQTRLVDNLGKNWQRRFSIDIETLFPFEFRMLSADFIGITKTVGLIQSTLKGQECGEATANFSPFSKEKPFHLEVEKKRT
jgi:hypothetical protein